MEYSAEVLAVMLGLWNSSSIDSEVYHHWKSFNVNECTSEVCSGGEESRREEGAKKRTEDSCSADTIKKPGTERSDFY